VIEAIEKLIEHHTDFQPGEIRTQAGMSAESEADVVPKLQSVAAGNEAILNRSQCFIFFSSSVISGTALNRSATRPKSATLKIGASSSLFIATIVLESFMPARC
jgi:hypothetical protein